MDITQVEMRIIEWQAIGEQPVGLVCFLRTDASSNNRGIDLGVWDGREWTTEFGYGQPISWAPVSVACDSSTLRGKLNSFVRMETCPVSDNCTQGFVAGAHTAWGWARNRVRQIVEGEA